MHRIDTPDATGDGRFTEGDPTVPVPATTVSADWLNAVQDEVLAVLTAAGLTPAKNNNTQLLAALKKVVGTVNALTASRLETTRTIEGVSFDGTADIHRYATCSTAAGTAAKTASLAGFKLQTGAALRVKFTNANTATGATLNVGGTGAKPLYYHGKAVPAGLLAAGHTYAVVFNGTQYEIVGDILVLAAGGGLSFDAKGHLYVDFSLVPDEQMRAIVLSMMQQGGGLNVDGNGKLYVDFASMPTEKFELMLKSIRVPIWLTRNKSFYVDGTTGSDTLDEGRGESPSKPFKTIQAAVNYVTDNYNLSRYTAYINVSSGIYEEEVVVGSFSVTTGRLYIRKNPESESKPTIVSSLVSKDCVVISIQSGGTVYWDGIDVILNVEVTNKLSIEGTGIHVSRYTVVNVLNSTVTLNINSEGTISGLSCIQSSSFAQLNINYCNKLISNYIKGTKPHAFSVGSNAKMSLINLYGEHENDHLSVKGDFNTVCRVMDGYFYRSATKMPLVVADGPVTGSRYQVTQGGAIYIRGGGPHFFPGTTDGSIDESTYSWYK